jgi:GDP-L-fucose synthase
VYPEATLVFDTTKPDGSPRKLLDVSRLNALGWRHKTGLRPGIAATYQWFLAHSGQLVHGRVAAAGTA